jgi:tripartite-type tricarboxylate transporter receptor subunit TctC
MKKLFALLLLVPALCFAWQPDANKIITVTVPNPPGSGNELAFRELASIIAKTDKTTKFVIINQPGADGVVALNSLMAKTPDGYNIMAAVQPSTVLTNDIWEKNVKKFNWDTFVYPITYARSPLVLIASSKSAVNTPAEFVKLISSTSKPISVAVGGGAHRTAFEYLMIKGQGNADAVKTIRFQGPLQVVTSVAQYDGTDGTEFGILPMSIAQSLIQAGKVKPIGITGSKTLARYPTVPLLNGVAPGNNIAASWFIVLPPSTPNDVVAWYSKTFAAAIRTSEFKQWADDNAVIIDLSELTPEAVTRENKELRATYMPLLQKIDLSKD